MSYQTWHTYGIGVDMNELRPKIDENKLIAVIKASDIEENIADKFDALYIECGKDLDETCMVLNNDAFMLGVTSILATLIENQNPGLCVTACDDFEGTQYIVYCPDYPWHMNDFDKSLTEEKLTDIFVRFFNTITNETVTNEIVSKHEIENGG